MNSDAERTLGNLNVLSAMSQNDKLMTNEDHFNIYTPTTFRAIVRTWYGERRCHHGRTGVAPGQSFGLLGSVADPLAASGLRTLQRNR